MKTWVFRNKSKQISTNASQSFAFIFSLLRFSPLLLNHLIVVPAVATAIILILLPHTLFHRSRSTKVACLQRALLKSALLSSVVVVETTPKGITLVGKDCRGGKAVKIGSMSSLSFASVVSETSVRVGEIGVVGVESVKSESVSKPEVSEVPVMVVSDHVGEVGVMGVG